jgi:hypothetical protein
VRLVFECAVPAVRTLSKGLSAREHLESSVQDYLHTTLSSAGGRTGERARDAWVVVK